ncbi:MAG: Adenylate cyclase [Microgenomates group bacterium GW2011_GWA2_44_7]|nr:MAG: Adenylate cyclase [Microgenomates group bacterium GW2011_GWA2_44_7]
MFEKFFREVLFRSFLKIDLNANEQATAAESLSTKYGRGTKESLIYGLLIIPTLLFVDTSILSSVLIPITMVSGTAWFAVSLVNIKKKFEAFGNELTIDLYRSFVTSLIFLSLMALISLNAPFFAPISSWGKQYLTLVVLSGGMGTILVIKMIYDVFSGATKYDMNDSMLTGQSEAAEKYFKRSLSLLNSCASHLKTKISADVAGYFIGLAFYEVFNYMLLAKGEHKEVRDLISQTAQLKSKPPKSKKEISEKCVILVRRFLASVTSLADSRTQKSHKNIQLELKSIQENVGESQEVFNLRLATILEEMEDMLASQGEMLFKKRLEIERKFLVKSPPSLNSYPKTEILQGYLVSPKGEELRIRKAGEAFFKTTKKDTSLGSREEIEEYISKEEFERLWDQTEGRRIEKTRYRIPTEGLEVELDIFGGKKKGLVLAEVEFESKEKANEFCCPSWFAEEVTGDSKYKNANLAE